MINPNEAPEGSIAIKCNGTCDGCKYEDKPNCDPSLCHAQSRDDKENVKFTAAKI